MPAFLTDECKDLLSLILNPDPEKRFTIEDIRAHPWFNQIEHPPPFTPAIFIGKEIIPIDEKIMATI